MLINMFLVYVNINIHNNLYLFVFICFHLIVIIYTLIQLVGQGSVRPIYKIHVFEILDWTVRQHFCIALRDLVKMVSVKCG